MYKMLKRFLANSKANISLTFGIAIVPTVAVMGGALDFANSQQIQAKFQTSVDSAALAAAASQLDDYDRIKGIVSDYLENNGVLKGKYSKPKITVVQLGDDKLKVSIEADVYTNMLRVIGKDYIPVKAETVIARAFGNIDVALVLDNTGSMSGRKLTALKNASTDLIETVYTTKSKTSVVRMALVPFSNYVNVGKQHRNASWATNTQDTNSRSGRSSRNSRGKKKRYRWHGCMASRQNPWDTRDERYGIKIPGVLNRSCGRELTALTENKKTLLKEIKRMNASGATYIPSGLAWGWRVISEIEPFANPNPQKRIDTSKAIVLMTDGQNTRSARYNEYDHEGNSRSDADRVTADLCRNIKASNEKITIYTVAFEVYDNATRDMLRQCASSPSHYFDASNSSALTAAFKKIAKSLASLRIAQ